MFIIFLLTTHYKSIIDNNHEIEEKVRVDELYKYRIRGIVGNSETIHAFAIVDMEKMSYL